MTVGRTNRREFIARLGGLAAWPMVAHGQRTNECGGSGSLCRLPNDDLEGHARVAAGADDARQHVRACGLHAKLSEPKRLL
jgi:hypothetical protein